MKTLISISYPIQSVSTIRKYSKLILTVNQNLSNQLFSTSRYDFRTLHVYIVKFYILFWWKYCGIFLLRFKTYIVVPNRFVLHFFSRSNVILLMSKIWRTNFIIIPFIRTPMGAAFPSQSTRIEIISLVYIKCEVSFNTK